jgi:hypothetical protein
MSDQQPDQRPTIHLIEMPEMASLSVSFSEPPTRKERSLQWIFRGLAALFDAAYTTRISEKTL